MADIKITITEKTEYPYKRFREAVLNFTLKEGFTIVDAHQVLVDMAENMGKEISKKKEAQLHAQAIYLLEEEKHDGLTHKELHEQEKCYCYRKEKQTDRVCIYKDWKDGKIIDSEAVARLTDY